MKKVVFIIALMLFSTITNAQGTFDKLEDLDDVTTVVVTKDMFDLLRKFPDSKSTDMKVFNISKGLQELKVFSTKNTTIVADMEKMVSTAIAKSNMKQLMRVKDKKARVKIYVKSTKNKDIVSEVLMFVNSKEDTPSTTIISLVGEINMNELAEIANNYEKKEK